MVNRVIGLHLVSKKRDSQIKLFVITAVKVDITEENVRDSQIKVIEKYNYLKI